MGEYVYVVYIVVDKTESSRKLVSCATKVYPLRAVSRVPIQCLPA